MAGSVLVQAPFPSPKWHGHLDSFPSGARHAMDAFLDRLVVLEANRDKGIRLESPAHTRRVVIRALCWARENSAASI
jgi:hypothetical protein